MEPRRVSAFTITTKRTIWYYLPLPVQYVLLLEKMKCAIEADNKFKLTLLELKSEYWSNNLD